MTKCSTTPTTPPTAGLFNYPYGSAPALSSVVFNESTVLKAFAGQGDKIIAWYSDEHALTLGVRQTVVTASGGTVNTTNYPFSSFVPLPGLTYNSVTDPNVGTTWLTSTGVTRNPARSMGWPDFSSLSFR